MLTLAFDTCYGKCSVAVGDAYGTLLAYNIEENINMQSRRLLDMINQCLCMAGGCGYSDIAKLLVTNGPGSFTGIRIGLAAALGLQVSLGIPVATVSTLAIVAQEIADSDFEYVVQLEAGREQFYQQVFTNGIAMSEIFIRSTADSLEFARQKACPVLGFGENIDVTMVPNAQLLLKYASTQNVAYEGVIEPLYIQQPKVQIAKA